MNRSRVDGAAENGNEFDDVNVRIVPRGFVGGALLDKLFNLHAGYFENTDIETFTRDLSGKNWVILASDKKDNMLGFSTIECLELDCDGEKTAFMFSGDTIIAQSAWRRNVLIPALGLFLTCFINDHSNMKCYWFLITKGYRTYRGLPIFFKRFYPNYLTHIPQREAFLLNRIAVHKFGRYYNPHTNVISFDNPHDYLKPFMQGIPQGKQTDPHTAFFLMRNPHFTRGDELACIAELSFDNFNRAAARIIEIGKKTTQWKRDKSQ
jgi:hypothetical protein